MRWLFIKREETSRAITYSYSRESSADDGIIVFYKSTNKAVIEQPCEIDKTEWDVEKTLGKFISCVVEESFPVKRLVVIG